MIKTITFQDVTIAIDPGNNIELKPGTLDSESLANYIRGEFVVSKYGANVFHHLTIIIEQDKENAR